MRLRKISTLRKGSILFQRDQSLCFGIVFIAFDQEVNQGINALAWLDSSFDLLVGEEEKEPQNLCLLDALRYASAPLGFALCNHGVSHYSHVLLGKVRSENFVLEFRLHRNHQFPLPQLYGSDSTNNIRASYLLYHIARYEI